MKRRGVRFRNGGNETGKMIVSVFATIGVMILLALLAGHGYGEAVREFDSDAIGVERYCTTVSLYFGASSDSKLVRIDDPSGEECKAVISRYRARLRHVSWTRTAIMRDLRTAENSQFKLALEKRLAHLDSLQLLIVGRLCRELFVDRRGTFLCRYSSNRSYGGLGGRIVRLGIGPMLGDDSGGSGSCTKWPLRLPVRTPPFNRLFAPPAKLPKSWPDIEAVLGAYGFKCGTREARCSFKSGFFSYRDDELMGIAGTTVVFHLVAGTASGIEHKSLSKQRLSDAGIDVRLCIGFSSMTL